MWRCGEELEEFELSESMNQLLLKGLSMRPSFASNSIGVPSCGGRSVSLRSQDAIRNAYSADGYGSKGKKRAVQGTGGKMPERSGGWSAELIDVL